MPASALSTRPHAALTPDPIQVLLCPPSEERRWRVLATEPGPEAPLSLTLPLCLRKRCLDISTVAFPIGEDSGCGRWQAWGHGRAPYAASPLSPPPWLCPWSSPPVSPPWLRPGVPRGRSSVAPEVPEWQRWLPEALCDPGGWAPRPEVGLSPPLGPDRTAPLAGTGVLGPLGSGCTPSPAPQLLGRGCSPESVGSLLCHTHALSSAARPSFWSGFRLGACLPLVFSTFPTWKV